VKVDPWSPPKMFIDHKIYENPPKMQKRPKMVWVKKWASFHPDPIEIFKLLYIPNRLVGKVGHLFGTFNFT